MQRLINCLHALILILPLRSGAELVKMKIVEEPSNYGLNNYQFGNNYQNDDTKLKMRIKPSNFSGPLHFKRFFGNCFKKEIESYKYEFCPFFNATQHELTYRWNPFHGVLGVWQEWEITNNTFVTMVMREGEKCGNIYRTVKIKFMCGEKHDIVNVTEPSTCNYEMWFSTPFVCHKLSMLVYPTLSEALQREWDSIETDLFKEDITQKGYDKRLRKLFEKAGYYLSKETQEKISASAIQQEETEEKEEKGEFESLSKCTEEYKKLKKEIEGLRTVLALKDSKEETDTKVGDHQQRKDDRESLRKSRRENRVSKFKEVMKLQKKTKDDKSTKNKEK